MPTGTLAQVAPNATTNTSVYTVPVGKVATFNVNVLNRGLDTAKVRLAVSANTTPNVWEFIEYDSAVTSSGVLERTGIVASAGKILVCYTDSANVSVNVYGYED